MATTNNTDVAEEELARKEPISEDELEDVEDDMEDEDDEGKEIDFEKNLELHDDYPAPEQEQKHNAHIIINRALERPDTVRTTFLTESELGRPAFSVRFLSDLHDDAVRLELKRIADYYYEKIQNITSTGMSNKGFIMNLNVTQKRDTTRRRLKESQQEMKKK